MNNLLQKHPRGQAALPYLIILFAALVIIAPQVIAHSMILGSDSIFHFNRFYDAAKQVQNHNFSFFQTNYGFQQSGRIINAIYGPLFAYLNGCILGLVGTWYRYQILSSLVIYWLAGVGMYRLARYVKSSPQVATLLALTYMNIGWLPRWETAQNMNAWGAALAPFLGICAVRMVQDRQRPVNPWALMAIMTVIIQIHMLSSLFFALTLVPFFIVGVINAEQPRQMWWSTIKAGLGTIVLTANVWGALLAIQMTNSIAKPAPFKLTESVLLPSLQTGTRDYIIVGLLLLFLAQICYVVKHFQQSLTNTTVTLVGAVFLLLSSPLIPWGMIEKLWPGLERFLQFPDRLTVIAYPLLLAGIAITTTFLEKRWTPAKFQKVVGSTLLILVIWVQAANMYNIHEACQSYYTDEVISEQGGVATRSPHDHLIRRSVHTLHPGQLLQLVEKRSPDYLPIAKKNLSKKYVRSYAYENQIIEHANEFQHTVLPGGRLELTWHSYRAGEQRLPIVTYHQSQLTVNGQLVKHYRRSSIGAPYIHQRKGRNQVILEFMQPRWVTWLIWLSLVGITLTLLYGGVQLIKLGVKGYRSCYNTNAEK